MIRDKIQTILHGQNLTRSESKEVFQHILEGKVSDIQLASFLTALRIKKESIEEISGAVTALRQFSTKIYTKRPNILDTCGTGGDGLGTFNISTASAIVASSAGAAVAKHGNKSVSSSCGSADVLLKLGVNIEIPAEKISSCLETIGLAFLFAPILNGAMKYAAPVRKELGFRTIFNMIGPLTNPAGASRQIIGVYDRNLTEIFVNVLSELGSERAMVVHGLEGLDEISIAGPTQVSELKEGKISTYQIRPEQFQMTTSALDTINGGDADTNAQIIRMILNGKQGAPLNVTVLNSGAALYISGIASSVTEGIEIARDAIISGKALKQLQLLIDFTNS